MSTCWSVAAALNCRLKGLLTLTAVLDNNVICWSTSCLVHAAEETSAQIQLALQKAANLGFSAQDLLHAAVDSLSTALEGSAPSNESAPAKRLRLLVSPCQSGCLERKYCSTACPVSASQCMQWRLHALQRDSCAH